MYRHVVTVVLILAAVAPLAAQGVAGRWTATFDADISAKGDSFVVKSRRPATLELTQHGDSVHGTWKTEIEPIAVRGTFDGKTLTLTSGTNEREVRVNGQPTKLKTRTDWSATVTGSSLAGSMFIHMGDRDAVPRKWEARR